MDTRRLHRFGITLILVMFSVTAGLAQSVSDGTITGTVTLPSGENAPGVTVTIKSDALVAGERNTTTNSEGKFVFLSLPPGEYDLSATLSGFKTSSTRDLALHSGDKRDLRITLQTGAFEESIIVSGAAPVVDTRTSTTETTFTAELLNKLPTARDAFYDIALSAPGVAGVGADESWLPSPSAYGSAANENLFLVNGVNATNPRGAPWGSLVQVNYNTVEEVKILALGTKAEYGSFSGLAIDVLTKSGGNEFLGDVAYYTQLGEGANNYNCNQAGGLCLGYGDDDLFFADPADDLTTTPLENWSGSVTLGGPILRDRLWFYGGYNTSWSETDTPLFEPLSEWEADLWDLKLTGEFGPQHRAWLGYHYEDLRAGNVSWGSTWDGSMVYDQPRDNETIQAQYQWVISDRDIFSGKFLGFETEEHPTIPNENGHPGFINWWKWIGTQSIGVGGDFPYVEKQLYNRQTLQADYTHYAAQFLGEHELKFGVQYTRSEGNWIGGYFHQYANFAYPTPWTYNISYFVDWYGWGTSAEPLLPFYNMKIYQNPWLTVRQADTKGLFIDDTWTLNDRLTFDLGARFDQAGAKYGEGAVYDMPATPEDMENLTEIRKREGTDNIYEFDTFSPRLGFAWTLTDDRKTVLRAHVGRYFAPLGVETLRRFGPDMSPTRIETWQYMLPANQVDVNHNGMIDAPYETILATRMLAGRTPDSLLSTTTPDRSWSLEVDPGTDSPYTDQFNMSIQRQIGANMSIEAGYVYKNTRNFIAFQAFNDTTGDLWEWVPHPFTTFTGFDTTVWEVALKDYDGDGKADINDAKFVLANTGYRAGNITEFGGEDVERTYNGLQLVLNRRYADRWQGMAAVNWNESRGLAPRTTLQDYFIEGPMIMDTPFGTHANDFQNNLNGPVPMTPELMVKVAGSYTIPVIETDFGLRYRYDSGRPFFPVQILPAFASWMSSLDNVYLVTGGNPQMVAEDPDNADWYPSSSIVDLSLNKNFTISGFGLNVSLDVLNALNEDVPNRVGWKEADYGRVYSLVQGRTMRAGLKFSF
jgi:outer membrane receptor protein involved in Fe transport